MENEAKNNEEQLEEENAEESVDNGSNEAGADDVAGSQTSDKTFTQADVTRMMTKEKKQGRNSVYNELGISPDDKETIAMVKAFVAAKSGDNEEVDSEELQEARQRALVAEAKAEAMMQGVQTKYVDDLVTLALSGLEEDGDLKTVIGEFKTKYPVWFESSEEDDDKKKAGKGTGSSISNSKNEKKQEGGIGARLAAQRKSSAKKSSYWGKND